MRKNIIIVIVSLLLNENLVKGGKAIGETTPVQLMKTEFSKNFFAETVGARCLNYRTIGESDHNELFK